MEEHSQKSRLVVDDPKAVEVLCLECKRPTKHKVIAAYVDERDTIDRDAGWDVRWVDQYQLVQCQGCENTTFRHTSWFSEDDWQGMGETVRLYPARTVDTKSAKALQNVPSNLRRIYSEIVDSFNAESATLCAAGLRALLEGVCAEQNVKGGTVIRGGVKKRTTDLEGKISGLQEKGLLTETQATTLHQHRYLGNEAVHELARPPQEELALAIEIIESTLEHLYELPSKAAKLQAARAARKP